LGHQRNAELNRNHIDKDAGVALLDPESAVSDGTDEGYVWRAEA
jgi:hypothetical protein